MSKGENVGDGWSLAVSYAEALTVNESGGAFIYIKKTVNYIHAIIYQFEPNYIVISRIIIFF